MIWSFHWGHFGFSIFKLCLSLVVETGLILKGLSRTGKRSLLQCGPILISCSSAKTSEVIVRSRVDYSQFLGSTLVGMSRGVRRTKIFLSDNNSAIPRPLWFYVALVSQSWWWPLQSPPTTSLSILVNRGLTTTKLQKPLGQYFEFISSLTDFLRTKKTPTASYLEFCWIWNGTKVSFSLTKWQPRHMSLACFLKLNCMYERWVLSSHSSGSHLVIPNQDSEP